MHLRCTLLFNLFLDICYLNKRMQSSFLTANFPELENFPDTINSYESLHKFSIENTDVFWGTLAKSRLDWFENFTQVTSGSFNDVDFHLKWFINGKLNVSCKEKLKF